MAWPVGADDHVPLAAATAGNVGHVGTAVQEPRRARLHPQTLLYEQVVVIWDSAQQRRSVCHQRQTSKGPRASVGHR